MVAAETTAVQGTYLNDSVRRGFVVANVIDVSKIRNFLHSYWIMIMDGRMEGWMGGWMDGWTDGRMGGRTDRQLDICRR